MEDKQEVSKSEPPPTLKSNTSNTQPLHPDKKIDWNSPDIIIEDDDGSCD